MSLLFIPRTICSGNLRSSALETDKSTRTRFCLPPIDIEQLVLLQQCCGQVPPTGTHAAAVHLAIMH